MFIISLLLLLFFLFFLMNGNTERAQCALSRVESAALKKRKRKAIIRIKQIYKIFKKVNKKKNPAIFPKNLTILYYCCFCTFFLVYI